MAGTPELSFSASTTYLDAVITNWPNAGLVNAANVAVPTDLAGARLANAPHWQALPPQHTRRRCPPPCADL